MNDDISCKRTFGCLQCLGGCFGCPLFCTGSFLIGVGLTTRACFNLNCLSEDFEKEREKWCVGCGIGTSCALSSLLLLKGYDNMISQPRTKPVVICQTEMVR